MERRETAVFATSATQYNTQNWVHIMHSAENRAFQFLMQPFINQLLFALKKTRKCQRNPAVLLPQFLLEDLEVGKLMLEPVRLSQSSLKLGAGIECLFCCVAEGPSLPRGPWHLHGLQEAVPLPLAWVCQHAFLWGCGGHMPSLMAGCLCRLTPVCPQGAWPGAPWHVCLTLLPPCCSVCTQVLAVGASQ